jgi:O-antigen/teichoic acid export membrane protein
LASTGFLQLSMIFARHFGSSAQAGFFAAVLSLLAPLYFVPRALSLALFPAMAGAHGEGDTEAVRRQTDLSTRLLIGSMLPVFVAGIVLARPILSLAFGREYAASQGILAIMLIATFVSIIPVPAVNSLSAVAARYVKVSAWASLAGLVVGVIWWLAFGRSGGVRAVAVGYLLGSLIQTAIPMGVAWRLYRLPWRTTMLAMTAGCAVAAPVVLYAVNGSLGLGIRLALAVGFALAWYAATWTQYRPLLAAVRRRPVPRAT